MQSHDKARPCARALPGNKPVSLIPLSEIDHTQGETTTPKRLHPLKRLHRNPWAWIGAGCLVSWLAGFPHIAGGLFFAVALFHLNQLVDSHMTGGDQ